MKKILLRVILFTWLALFFTFLGAQAKAPMVTKVSRLRYEVSLSAVEKNLVDPVSQLSTFVALPSFDSGLFTGIRVEQFSKHCLLPRFGLEEGDVVEFVDGSPIRGPSDIFEQAQRLSKVKVGSKIRVTLLRQGQSIVQSYLVVQ